MKRLIYLLALVPALCRASQIVNPATANNANVQTGSAGAFGYYAVDGTTISANPNLFYKSSNGYVGVSTGNPQAQLDVNGGVLANGLTVNTSFGVNFLTTGQNLTQLGSELLYSSSTVNRVGGKRVAYALNVQDFGATGNGSTDDSAAFTAAAASGPFVVPSGTYRISNSIGVNNFMTMLPGAQLQIDSAKVVTTSSGIAAPPTQVFAGAGTVVVTNYGAMPQVYAEWWGALSNGSNDDCLAIQKAANALTQGGELHLLPRPYTCKTSVVVTNHSVTVQGTTQGLSPIDYGSGGYGGTRIIGTNGVTPTLAANNVGYFKVKDIMMYLPAAASVATVGISFQGLYHPVVQDVSIYNYSTAMKSTSTVDAYVQRAFLGSTGVTVDPVVCFDDDTSNHAQNASLYISHTICANGGYSGNAYGFWAHGNRINDLYLDMNESDGNTYNYYIDGTAGIDAGYAADIHLRGNIADTASAYGFYVNGVNTDSIIGISNGWAAGDSIGVAINNSRNVRVEGMELFGGNDAVYVAASTGCVIHGNQINYPSQNGILVDNASFNTIADNSGYQVSNASATFINLLTSSTYNTIQGNVANSTVASGWLNGIAAVATYADHNTYVGNVFKNPGTNIPMTVNLATNSNSVEMDVSTAALPSMTAPTITDSGLSSGNIVKTTTGGLFTTGTVSLTSQVSGTLPIANGGTNSTTSLGNQAIMVSSNSKVVENPNGIITGNRVMVTDGNGFPGASVVPTATEAFLANVTSDVQTQLNTKIDTAGTGLSKSGTTLNISTPIAIANGGTNSATSLSNSMVMVSSNSKVVENPNGQLTGNRVVVSDGNGFPGTSVVTTTEEAFVSGVTSNIQTQLSALAPIASPTFTGVLTSPAHISTAGTTASVSGTGTNNTALFTTVSNQAYLVAVKGNTDAGFSAVFTVWDTAGGINSFKFGGQSCLTLSQASGNHVQLTCTSCGTTQTYNFSVLRFTND